MENFIKTVRVGIAKPPYAKRGFSVFCKIQLKDGRLSISGVEGPTISGNCRGACGQIDSHDWHIKDYAPGWSKEVEGQFRAVWKKWHLNDMKSGTPAQMAYLEEHPITDRFDHYTAACQALTEAGLNPDNGYEYGSAWLRVDVPEEVLEFLCSLPDTDQRPAWV